jgi:hypothetical protein
MEVMPMTRWILRAAIALTAACGSRSVEGPVIDAAGDGDGPAGDAIFDARSDAVPGADARTFAGVACGIAPTLTCTPPTSECCVAGNDTCIMPEAACTGERMQCDGTEDCNGGDVCCFRPGDGARCAAAAMCNGTDVVMCHPDGPKTCVGALKCCQLGPGPTTSPYGVCRAFCPQ